MQSKNTHYNSLFFNHLRFQVPLLALESYAYFADGVTTEETMVLALTSAIAHSCHITEPSPEDLTYFVERLQEVHKEAAEVPKPAKMQKSFGTSYAEYLGAESVSGILGLMTNFDIDKMRRLYCEIDFSYARELMKAYTRHRQELNLVAYEAALYGAGNSYKGDNGGKSGALDPDSPEGRAMMAQFGIGVIGAELPADLLPKI